MPVEDVMAFCPACGHDVGEAAFCSNCGASQARGPSGTETARHSPMAGIEENIAGLLCYLFFWVSGLVFLLLDKRPFVRFHAAQSVGLCVAAAVIGAGFGIFYVFVTFIIAIIHLPMAFLIYLVWRMIWVACFTIWVYCMYKAYQHEKFKLPIIGDMVEKMVGA